MLNRIRLILVYQDWNFWYFTYLKEMYEREKNSNRIPSVFDFTAKKSVNLFPFSLFKAGYIFRSCILHLRLIYMQFDAKQFYTQRTYHCIPKKKSCNIYVNGDFCVLIACTWCAHSISNAVQIAHENVFFGIFLRLLFLLLKNWTHVIFIVIIMMASQNCWWKKAIYAVLVFTTFILVKCDHWPEKMSFTLLAFLL